MINSEPQSGNIPILQQFIAIEDVEDDLNYLNDEIEPRIETGAEFEPRTEDDNGIVNRTNVVHIEMEDIDDEINFWSSSVICYIVGANPSIQVMEGHLCKVWKQLIRWHI